MTPGGAWSDSPLPETSISGRQDFVRALAQRIEDVPTGTGTGTGSTAFGLVGPWGSGKTTLLHNVGRTRILSGES